MLCGNRTLFGQEMLSYVQLIGPIGQKDIGQEIEMYEVQNMKIYSTDMEIGF
jgi:hypothetical protein